MPQHLPLGTNGNGVVHYDSRAKHSYIWPLCGLPYQQLYRTHNRVVTCLACLADYEEYYGGDR